MAAKTEGQILHTANYGPIIIEKSWQNKDAHIAKLVGGGYVHITGLPVQNKAELKAAIPPGPELELAYHWLENKDQLTQKPERRIIMEPDGTLLFEDGAPVESLSEVVNYFPTGPALDMALSLFAKQQERRQQIVASQQTEAGQEAVEVFHKKTPLGRGKTVTV